MLHLLFRVCVIQLILNTECLENKHPRFYVDIFNLLRALNKYRWTPQIRAFWFWNILPTLTSTAVCRAKHLIPFKVLIQLYHLIFNSLFWMIQLMVATAYRRGVIATYFCDSLFFGKCCLLVMRYGWTYRIYGRSVSVSVLDQVQVLVLQAILPDNFVKK